MSIVSVVTGVAGVVTGIGGIFGGTQEKDYAQKQAAIDTWYNQALSEGQNGPAYAKLLCVIGQGPTILQAPEWPVAASGRREIRCDGSSSLRTYAQIKIEALKVAWTASGAVRAPIAQGVAAGNIPLVLVVVALGIIVLVVVLRKRGG